MSVSGQSHSLWNPQPRASGGAFLLCNQSQRSELSLLRKTKDSPSAMFSWPRFGGKFYYAAIAADVRFTPESGHRVAYVSPA